MKDSKKEFLAILFLSVALLISLYVARQKTSLNSSAHFSRIKTLTWTFPAGWNNFSLPLDTKLTASQMCSLVPGLTDIYTYINSWTSHYGCQMKNQTDYSISNFRAYAIHLSADAKLSLTGNPVEYTSSHIVNGLNYVGFSVYDRRLTARQLCGRAFTRPFEMVTIYRKPPTAGLTWSTWDEYNCQSPKINNFDIQNGEGYFIKVQLPSKLTPSVAP